MPLQTGTHRLGPENGTLLVKTGRTGVAAKAGHDLVIEVTSWTATIEAGEDPALTSIALDADASTLRVRKGTGGVQALGDEDKESIQKTIDDEILTRQEIAFRSSAVHSAASGSRFNVQGELKLVGKERPIAFDLDVGEDGELSAIAVLEQTDWGIKLYSILFGTLKVADEVEVTVEARLT